VQATFIGSLEAAFALIRTLLNPVSS